MYYGSGAMMILTYHHLGVAGATGATIVYPIDMGEWYISLVLENSNIVLQSR